MRAARLTMALDSGTIALPESGAVFVFRPHRDDELSMLGPDRITVIQGFRPDHDHFAAQGLRVAVAAEGVAAGAVVCLPRSRAAARAMIAEAEAHVAAGGPVIVDGQKTDGVDAVARAVRDRVETSVPLAKAHGRVFAFAAGSAFADWVPGEAAFDGFVTDAGMFSADGPDRGSAMLAAALPAALPARVVDLGAGWGYLARAILARDGVRQLDLVEAEHAALSCARRNVADARARFHWADALTFRPETPVDAVVMNPPFHLVRDADPGLGADFIRAAAGMLHPGGTLWMVANRHLPYAAVLAGMFRDVAEIGGDGTFRLIRAARPLRARP